MEIKSLTKEELKVKIEELTSLKNELKNEEQAVKLTMNSIYGAVGNNYFACFNTDVAEAVTLQGQDLIKYSEKIIHRYFHEFWHDDFELHEKLGVTDVKKVHKPLTIYGDTDSVFSSSVIHGKDEFGNIFSLKIEDLFRSFVKKTDVFVDHKGNQIIEDPNISVLNYLNNCLGFSQVKKIIRHKVSKPKWKIVTRSGKEIIVTDDHSITVFRYGKKIHIKPSEINLEIDGLATVHKDIEFKHAFEKIKSNKHIGSFEDEYVYDLEIAEEGYDNQTFFANDILVHNSNYVTFQEVVASCGWEGDPKELILKINEFRLKGYLKKCFEIYSKKWNTDNYQDFELETLSINAIFLGKKKYVTNTIYSDGVEFEPLTNIKTTGVEMIKGGTPAFVREKLMFLTKFILTKGKSFNIREFVTELKAIKKDFKAQEPERIALAISVNNYEKFILNDTTGFEFAKGTPMHVRASGYHNFILNNSKYKDKYPLLGSGDKVRIYFVKTKNAQENNVFAYAQGNYPYEYAPPVDLDEQFTKTILDPINRFIEVMGHHPISPNLFMINTLF